MAEKPRSKASQFLDELAQRSPSPESVAAMSPRVPELRLRADAPSLEINGSTLVSNAVAQLRSETVGAIVLREPGAEPTAVVMPVERYLELVGTELVNDSPKEARGGGLAPRAAALEAVYVEQVDPSGTWHRGGG